jgi:hypothetical protein
MSSIITKFLNGHWWGRGEKRRGKCDQNILKMLIKSKMALKKKKKIEPLGFFSFLFLCCSIILRKTVEPIYICISLQLAYTNQKIKNKIT